MKRRGEEKIGYRILAEGPICEKRRMEREGGLQRVGQREANAKRKGEESSQRVGLCEAEGSQRVVSVKPKQREKERRVRRGWAFVKPKVRRG